MIIEIDREKETTYNCPEGAFSAELIAVKPILEASGAKPKHLLKFIFEVQVPTMPDMNVIVIKKYAASTKGKSPLKKMLEGWLGKEWLKQNGQNFNTDDLVGEKADLIIKHVVNDGYEEPYVMVESIHPLGSINKGEGI